MPSDKWRSHPVGVGRSDEKAVELKTSTVGRDRSGDDCLGLHGDLFARGRLVAGDPSLSRGRFQSSAAPRDPRHQKCSSPRLPRGLCALLKQSSQHGFLVRGGSARRGCGPYPP
jgi:hypothetical protein